MKKRLVLNDLKANKLLSFSTWAFMTLCALLIALTCFLFTDLLGAIDVLMDAAQTPDFVQMHAGDMDEDALARFVDAQKDAVADAQVLRFLNLENSVIDLGGHLLTDSTQDNGVSVQSEKFDLLLDPDNRVILAAEGELYVPMCYKQSYGLQKGDPAKVCGYDFTIAGFVRDSQMNSMMSSSKRFVVCAADYERLQSSGSEEYLIELRAQPGADVNAVSTAYADAGLPANGPTITRPLIKLMNALSDGMTALVILLVSVVMLLISMLCIRFTLLSRLEADRREIGMLKAVGISRKDIRSLYMSKYVLLSALGALVGVALALVFKQPLQSGLQELYGKPGSGTGSLIAALVGVAVTELVLLWSVSRTLKRTEKMTAVEALNGRDNGKEKRASSRSALIAFVIAAGVFLMVVPQNLHSTLSAPEFVTYMGIGGGQVRVDIRQTDNIADKTEQAVAMFEGDASIERFVSLQTKSMQGELQDGTRTRLTVEIGDHTAYPVAYDSGSAPVKPGEIALSYLCADDLGLKVGDPLTITVMGQPMPFTVCGIYSDITNGGKTAKAAWVEDDSPVMWSVFYLTLKDADLTAWIDACEQKLAAMDISAKVVDLADYVKGIYGATLDQIALASQAARLAAVVVILVVVTLFADLLVAGDRNDIALRKALGFTSGEIKRMYALRLMGLACVGAVIGVFLGCVPGQWLVGAMLKSLGAAGFRFIINAPSVCVLLPVIALVAVAVAVVLGLKKITKIRAYECCVGRE